MQGQESSLSVWTALLDQATADSNKPAHKLKISWLRTATSAEFAQVGVSVVGGAHLVQGVDDQAVTKSDLFEFYDESDKALVLEYEHLIQEPLGGIVYGMADVILDNTDLRFTPNVNSTIGTAIKPNRPVQIYIGFYLPTRSHNQPIPIFKGLSGQIKENKKQRTAEFHAQSYLSFANEQKVESAIYQDQRTDQILQDMFVNDLGFSTDQLAFDQGLNTIDFAWFERETTLGHRIKQLVESEDATLYQDEFGIVRFETRRHYNLSPHNASVHNINTGDIIEWEELEPTKIINSCIVKAEPRAVQADQEVWRLGATEELATGETKTIWAQFEDPVTSFSTATIDANTASDGTGTDISTDIGVSVTAFTKSAKIVLTNNAGTKAYVRFLSVNGTPASITNKIEELYEDSTSIDKYDRQEFVIENDFINSTTFAEYLASSMVRKFSKPLRKVRLTIRGVPQLQVKDFVTVSDFDTNTTVNFRVISIRGNLSPGEFTQLITLRQITDDETDNWATVGTSTVGGTDIVGI